MRKFCQNLQNAQLCRPKTGILSAFLPSAAGQNSDTFPVLHTVERGVSLQGRGKLGDTPSVLPLRVKPPSPRGRLNSLSQNLTVLPAPSGREPLARPGTLRFDRKAFVCRWMFSFDTKREPEKCQRFRRAGATKKGLLAPFNPKEVGYTGKN